jgi:hypothetical protein
MTRINDIADALNSQQLTSVVTMQKDENAVTKISAVFDEIVDVTRQTAPLNQLMRILNQSLDFVQRQFLKSDLQRRKIELGFRRELQRVCHRELPEARTTGPF